MFSADHGSSSGEKVVVEKEKARGSGRFRVERIFVGGTLIQNANFVMIIVASYEATSTCFPNFGSCRLFW